MKPEDLNAMEIQQEYFENLIGCDWVKYERKDHAFLLRKIAFALFGAPASEGDVTNTQRLSGYTARQAEIVNNVYNKVLEQKKYSLNSSDIVMSVLLVVCCQPKPLGNFQIKPRNYWVGLHRKKSSDIVSSCTAVFRIRKCIPVTGRPDGIKADSSCRIYVDENARVYYSWDSYKQNNTLPKCVLVLPENGEYKGDLVQDGALAVRLSVVASPALGARARILSVADTTSTVASLGALGVLGAAVFTPVGPVVLAGATVATVATGLYGIVRSSLHLHDRRMHEQSIGAGNPEARSSYFNIAASTVGIAAGASSKLLATVTASGKNVTTAGKVLEKSVDVLRICNLVTNGGGLVNTFASLVVKYRDGEQPSKLEVFQFASSALFFVNAVMTNKTARSIIEDSQIKTIGNFRANLKQVQRKIFDEATNVARSVKGVIGGNNDIIRGIKIIDNKQQYFADIVRSGKDRKLILPIGTDGRVKLDANIDSSIGAIISNSIPGIVGMTVPTDSSFVSVSPGQIIEMGRFALKITASGIDGIAEMLEEFSARVHKAFIMLCVNLMPVIPEDLQMKLKLVYPNDDILTVVARMLLNYFKKVTVNGDTEGLVSHLEEYFYEGRVRKEKIKELNMIVKKMYRQARDKYWMKRDVCCIQCGGYYYE